MLLLDEGHVMIKDTISSRLGSENERYRSNNPCDMGIADFDDVFYRVKCRDNDCTVMMHLPGFTEIEKYGMRDYLAALYEGMVGPGVEDRGVQYHVTLNFSLQQDPANADEFLEKICSIKRHCMSAPFRFMFQKVEAKTAGEELIVVPYRRGGESIYIKATKEGSVIVIYQIKFKDPNDITIADVFMKEFTEVRREPGLNQAPSVLFSKTAPLELKSLSGVHEGADTAFISFALFPRHFTGAKCEQSISTLVNFRNTLHYHIKCSKAYFHMRMRKRVDHLLQILNRAKPETIAGSTEKKTITGRTFIRS